MPLNNLFEFAKRNIIKMYVCWLCIAHYITKLIGNISKCII